MRGNDMQVHRLANSDFYVCICGKNALGAGLVGSDVFPIGPFGSRVGDIHSFTFHYSDFEA